MTLRKLSIISFLFVLAFFISITNVEASFNLSGSTITQIDTDADLSGLSGIAGVTVLTVGSGADGRTIYDIGDRRLHITGTLDITPELEAVYAGTASPRSVFDVRSGGTLNINGEIIENGVTRYSERLFMWSPFQSGSCCNNYGFHVRSGGTLNWAGGAMRIGSSLSFDSGAEINTVGSILFQDKNSDNQLRQSTTDWNSDSFIFTGNDITFIAIPNSFNGYQPRGARGALGFSGSTPNIDFPIQGYNSNGSSDSDLRHWSGSRPILTNSGSGTDLKVVPHISGNNSSYGVIIVNQDVQVSVVDNNGDIVEGVEIYAQDVDNGGREVYNRESHTVDATADFTYQHVTDATGKTSIYPIITGINIVNNGSSAGANGGDYAWDYRGKNNNSTDLFDFHAWSYEHQYQVAEAELKGVSTKDIVVAVLPDLNISETDISTVNGYSSIDTLDQLYDRAKAWKVDSANITYPAIDEIFVSGSGSILDLGEHDLIVDSTAPDAFSVDTSNQIITINSNSLGEGSIFTEILTTGLITYQNAAVQDTDYTDSTGFNPVDGTAPTITLIPQVASKIDGQAIVLDINVVDDRSINVNDVQVNLVNTTAGVTGLSCVQTSLDEVDCTLQVVSSGDVEIRAEDEKGLSSTELDTNYIIDQESPVISASLDTSSPFSLNQPEVVFSATDNVDVPGDITFTISVDDGPFVSETSPYEPTLVGDRHVIVLRAEDQQGNRSEYTYVYTPIITIAAPTTVSNSDIANTVITVSSVNDITNVTISGAGSTFTCSPLPSVAIPISGTVSCVGVITSTGTLSVDATDTLVTDTVTLDYVLEQTPPVITITAPTTSAIDSITDTSIVITDDVAIDVADVFIDGSSTAAARLFSCNQDAVDTVSCSIDVASSGDLMIYGRDRSGNASVEVQAYTITPAEFANISSGGGSNNLLLCNTDPTAVNYYSGSLKPFKFYKIVNKCIYGDAEPVKLPDSIYEKPKCTINYSRLIKKGLRGNDVKQVQRCMNSLGYTSGPEDGIYGPLTYAGITAYQRAHGLQYIDGIVGPETSGSLNDLGDVTVVGL